MNAPDVILYNGNITTLDEAHPAAGGCLRRLPGRVGGRGADAHGVLVPQPQAGLAARGEALLGAWLRLLRVLRLGRRSGGKALTVWTVWT
jgi:hypothetical protein